jgi:hypothetical protein
MSGRFADASQRSLHLSHQFFLIKGLFLYRGVERKAQRNAGNPQQPWNGANRGQRKVLLAI